MQKSMKVVGYVRISRDEDRENYSSILTQQDIIREFAQINNWLVSKIYIDDNVSGYTFDRPEFNKMLQELKKGNIDIIIAKDFSRIGRNQGEAMIFIDSIKKNNKRLILISDFYDSIKEDDIIGIKAWYNEMYLKDISRKIRASMSSKQKTGELIMGNYYGYKKIKVNYKFNLEIDEDIREVIVLIFKSYIDGLGYKKICDILNEKNYPTPSECIKERQGYKGKIFKNKVTSSWQTFMIKRIIHDDIYVGTLRTHKSRSQFGVMKGNQIKTEEKEQYIFKDHHKAIISMEDFKTVQEVSERRKLSPINSAGKNHYSFSGFVKCGDCGFAAIGKNIKKPPKIERGYNCTTYQKYGRTKCTNHSISEEKILFFYKEFLKDVEDFYKDFINNIDLKVSSKKNNIKDFSRLKNDLNNANEELKLLISQKIKDLIIENNIKYRDIIESSYFQLEEEKKKKINELNLRVLESPNINCDLKNKSTMEIFSDLINAEIPERKNLEQLLAKVVIHKDKNLEFRLLVNIDKLTSKIQK